MGREWLNFDKAKSGRWNSIVAIKLIIIIIIFHKKKEKQSQGKGYKEEKENIKLTNWYNIINNNKLINIKDETFLMSHPTN